jgi:hypothetical protein
MNLSKKGLEKIFPDDNMEIINSFRDKNWKGYFIFPLNKPRLILFSPEGKKWDSSEIEYYKETCKFLEGEAKEAETFFRYLSDSFRKYPLVVFYEGFLYTSLN